MAYVFKQNRDDGQSGASGMGQSSIGAGGMAEKRVGVDDSGAGGPSNTAGMPGAMPSAAPKAASDFTKTKNAGAGAILQRNRGVSQDSAVRRVAGDAMRNLQGNTADLQTRSTEYLTKGRQGIADTSKGLSDDDVRARLAPGQSTELQSRLSAQPVQVKDFDPGSFRPIEAMDYLRSGDVSGLLGRESSANYTSGMGALDGLAFNRSGAGQQVKSQVGGLQSQFAGDVEKAKGKEGVAATLKTEAETANAAGVTGLRGQIEKIASGITGGLGSRRSSASSQNAETVAAEKAARQGEIRSIVDEYKNKIATARKQPNVAGRYFDNLDEQLGNFVGDGSGLDKYISTSNPDLQDNMFLSDEETGMLNTASGLLGNGQTYARGQAGKAGATLDSAGFRRQLDALLNPGFQAAEAERAANAAAAAARARAATTQKAVAGGNSNQVTKAATGGNEGVTGGGTTVAKKDVPKATPTGVVKDGAKKLVDAAKKSPAVKAVTKPVAVVQDTAEKGKEGAKKLGKFLSGK